MDTTIHEHIEIVPGTGGPKAVIKGHRIRVVDVVTWHERLRMSPFEIVHEYPTVTVADVYAALAYYWDHRMDIEMKMAEDELEVQAMMRENPRPLRDMLREEPARVLEILKNRRAD